MYEDNEPLENTNIDLITIDGAYKSNEYTFAFTVFFCCLFGILLLFTSCAMFFQYKRLVLGDALRKANEERSETLENSDMSVTDSNEDIMVSMEVTRLHPLKNPLWILW